MRGRPSIVRRSSFVIRHSSRRAFTLVEMLIVVVILGILMSIVFRLGSITDGDERRTKTVVKLQRIENCLSGYYAAFGSYPPVKVIGSREILPVDQNGDQDPSGSGGSLNQKASGEAYVWTQVNAACRSQPFGCEYPGSVYDNEVIEEWAQELKERVENTHDYPEYAKSKFATIYQAGFMGPEDGDFTGVWDESDWKRVKLFKFGMMSFLLPRYLFMMGGDEAFFGRGGAAGSTGACGQWTDNNDVPCDPFEGEQFEEWYRVRELAQAEKLGTDDSVNRSDLARVANVPSQAVCARWMPNLAGMCVTVRQMTFFGIDIRGSGLPMDDTYPPDPGTHSPEGHAGKYYKNAMVTIIDGWDREFYYYSPAPYQSYIVWSAGANGKTFPPWMPLEGLQNDERETATKWMNDDIMQMSH